MASKVFEKYYSKVAKEGILKSLLVGLIVGFAVAFVVAFVTWFTGYFWISLLAGAAVTAATTLIVYNKAFKPTTKGIAKRIDMLGLQERLITMEELKNDESYIAMRQREDAMEKLRSVNESMIRLKISKGLITAAAIVVAIGLSMTTVSALAEFGIIGDGGNVFDQIIKPKPGVTYSVTYGVYNDNGGEIVGEVDQVVAAGADATMVVAVPEEGWAFVMWSDGNTNPVRTDRKISEDSEYEAIFLELSDKSGSGGDQDGDGEEGDPDAPSDPDAPPSEGNPEDSDKPQKPGEGAGGGKETNDNIIDGNTNYEDALGSGGYYEEQMKRLAESGELTPELKDIINRYFESIGKGNNTEEP